MRTRLAPTPSGFLHAGNAVNLLLIDALARANEARVLLRIDDLDTARTRPEYVEDLFTSLDWLDINWHEGPRSTDDLEREWSQRFRTARYQERLDRLRKDGHLYACVCSRTNAAACRCAQEQLSFEGPGTSWRLRVALPCPVDVPLFNTGSRRIDLHAVMPSPVLRQRDGSPAYQIASLSDDLDFAMSFIVRGEDLWASTACQVHLMKLLEVPGSRIPRYLHHPLIKDPHGNKLSKSAGASSLKAMRGTGVSSDGLRGTANAMLRARSAQGW